MSSCYFNVTQLGPSRSQSTLGDYLDSWISLVSSSLFLITRRREWSVFGSGCLVRKEGVRCGGLWISWHRGNIVHGLFLALVAPACPRCLAQWPQSLVHLLPMPMVLLQPPLRATCYSSSTPPMNGHFFSTGPQSYFHTLLKGFLNFPVFSLHCRLKLINPHCRHLPQT